MLLALAIVYTKSGGESGAVRKMRGTPRRSVGRHARDRHLFCPRAPWMCWPRIQAFSP